MRKPSNGSMIFAMKSISSASESNAPTKKTDAVSPVPSHGRKGVKLHDGSRPGVADTRGRNYHRVRKSGERRSGVYRSRMISLAAFLSSLTRHTE